MSIPSSSLSQGDSDVSDGFSKSDTSSSGAFFKPGLVSSVSAAWKRAEGEKSAPFAITIATTAAQGNVSSSRFDATVLCSDVVAGEASDTIPDFVSLVSSAPHPFPSLLSPFLTQTSAPVPLAQDVINGLKTAGPGIDEAGAIKSLFRGSDTRLEMHLKSKMEGRNVTVPTLSKGQWPGCSVGGTVVANKRVEPFNLGIGGVVLARYVGDAEPRKKRVNCVFVRISGLNGTPFP